MIVVYYTYFWVAAMSVVFVFSNDKDALETRIGIVLLVPILGRVLGWW